MATFVLVHGLGHGGWCWKKVRPLLIAAGHEVFTPTLTGMGERAHLLSAVVSLETHIQDILSVLDYEDLRDVVLVGHSYSGMVITGVADRRPERVAKLVYLDAAVPNDGQALADIDRKSAVQWRADARAASWSVPPLGQAGGNSEPFLRSMGIDDPADLAWMNPRMSPTPPWPKLAPLHFVNPRPVSLPRTFIYCTMPPFTQLSASVERARTEPGWDFRELAAGHDPMVTAPQELAAMFMDIAAAVR